MKNIKTLLILSFVAGLFVVTDMAAQYGYGYGGYGSPYGGRYGRGQSMIPNAGPTESKKDETPPTAEEIVDAQMPSITEELSLDPFEQAVVRTALVQSVQKKIEIQILEMEPLKTKEEFEKIDRNTQEELKMGLPEDKYNAFIALQENSFKADKKKKKKNKRD
ncbi:hypothetical protein [Flagellimonas sediminis]|uniref:Uncharacterized protein n=1 Tax=Flagellimonas sediminis TaxID=2696468 RepID=A0A6I5KPV1_9FLAO|nr:hypothetical protein [Allomuricauda sediminis]NDV42766.1 hypothetical protein [Allomuricauda sediminis]